ncbi:alpha/beta hydrolase [Paenibacillus hubeiensis]|uniref:alpha/beta hydrolase n=2 Tax=Paenibacillus TaxID=44249 RepID=UPI0031BB8536
MKSVMRLASPDHGLDERFMKGAGVSRLQDVVYGQEHDNSTLDVYYPTEAKKRLPIVVWIHGGGWVMGDKGQIAHYAAELAKRGHVVVSMNYALAPQKRYPSPVMQANQALAYVKEHAAEFRGDASKLFLAGNSAGAQIASQMAAVITNPSLARLMDIHPAVDAEQLRGVLLYCGPYNLSTVGQTGFPFMRTFLWSYTGMKDYEEYPRLNEMSAVLQVTKDFPPAFITSGNKDPLTVQSVELAQVLKRLEVETETLFFSASTAKLGHDYQFALDTASGKQALHAAARFIEKHSQ